MGRSAAAVVILAVAALLAGCGLRGEQGARVVPAPATPARLADADVASGCWKAASRVRRQEGSESVVGHQQWHQPPEMTIDLDKRYTATLQTNHGSIEVEFFPEDAPKTVNNFVCLARAGYYDGTPFHRILDGFVIQGGDPTGTGRGGPGYQFEDEPISRDYVKGTLAMANAGPNTNGSQFFIVLTDLRGQLSKSYTIFGQVIDGIDVVDRIAKTPTKTNERGEQSVPTEPVVLERVIISES